MVKGTSINDLTLQDIDVYRTSLKFSMLNSVLTKNGPTRKGLVKTIGAFGENLLVMIIVLYTLIAA